jgi:hypothetical protein
MPELIRAKNGAKKWRARRSRKREDSDDSIKKTSPRLIPKRSSKSSKKRPSQPIPDLICLSGGEEFRFSFTANITGPTLLVREDGVLS